MKRVLTISRWYFIPAKDGMSFKRLAAMKLNLQFFAADPERTEEATPKRKSDARKKGQVAKSTELNSVLVLLGLFIILNYLGGWFFTETIRYFKFTFSPEVLNSRLTDLSLAKIMLNHGLFFIKIFLPVGLGAMAIGLAVNYAQVGALFTVEPLKIQLNRLNPIHGFQRLFSTQGLVELAKAAVKLLIVGYFAYSTIKKQIPVLLQSVRQPPLEVALNIWRILYRIALKVCIFLFILALFDYAYQRWAYRKKLRMTKKEIKDERKQLEGNPLIRNKIRQRQLQVIARRMMHEVPKADVVITNPTHLAVAIRYEPSVMAAPVVVAKGADYIAAKIKEIAAAHQVSVVENKPLAQVLYKTVEIGETIPPKLFQAVAEVLAFVYRLRRKRGIG